MSRRFIFAILVYFSLNCIFEWILFLSDFVFQLGLVLERSDVRNGASSVTIGNVSSDLACVLTHSILDCFSSMCCMSLCDLLMSLLNFFLLAFCYDGLQLVLLFVRCVNDVDQGTVLVTGTGFGTAVAATTEKHSHNESSLSQRCWRLLGIVVVRVNVVA